MSEAAWHQLDIWGDAHAVDQRGRPITAVARSTDPETSHAAARSVRGETMRRLHRIVLVLLSVEPDTHSGLWGKYLMHQEENEWPIVSLSGFRTRVSELVAAALVEDSGRRDTLPTGRKSTVWRITPRGIDELNRARNRGR